MLSKKDRDAILNYAENQTKASDAFINQLRGNDEEKVKKEIVNRQEAFKKVAK